MDSWGVDSRLCFVLPSICSESEESWKGSLELVGRFGLTSRFGGLNIKIPNITNHLF